MYEQSSLNIVAWLYYWTCIDLLIGYTTRIIFIFWVAPCSNDPKSINCFKASARQKPCFFQLWHTARQNFGGSHANVHGAHPGNSALWRLRIFRLHQQSSGNWVQWSGCWVFIWWWLALGSMINMCWYSAVVNSPFPRYQTESLHPRMVVDQPPSDPTNGHHNAPGHAFLTFRGACPVRAGY